MEAAASHPQAETLRGRGRVLVVPAPPGDWPETTRWVLRHYHRGGALAGLLRDRYVRAGEPRPLREFGVAQAVRALGIPTAPPVGAAAYGAGVFYRGDLVTEWVPETTDLAATLFGAAQLDGQPSTGRASTDPLAAMEAAGGLVRLLHERGVAHPDLNLKNILIRAGAGAPRALIIDLDRARVRGPLPERARRRMLARFERSLRKWERRIAAPAPPGTLEAFHSGYGATPPDRESESG